MSAVTTLEMVVLGHLPSSISYLLAFYFGAIPGSYFYFCNHLDALGVLKELIPKRLNVKVGILSNNPSSDIFAVYAAQPQRIGVFLDLSCNEGYGILNQSLDKFNSTYRWMFWTHTLLTTLQNLEASRLEADSDVFALIGATSFDNTSIESEHVELMRITRLHYKSKFHLREKPLMAPPDEDIPVKPNFEGYCFNTSLMMINIQFNKSNLLEPLLDKSYAAGSDMVRRYGLSMFIHAAEYYNYTMSYVLTNAWGDPFGNGSWSGMVGQVQRGEAEFGLAPAKYIIPRYAVIDYVTSLHIVRVCFTFLQPTLFGTYKALMLPLDRTVWIGLGVCTVSCILAFRILVPHDRTSTQNDGWGGSTFLVVSTIANQGVPDNTYYLPTRIVYIFVLTVSFFVGVYYNTAILNGLLLQAPNAIQNIEQLLRSDVRLAMLDIPYLHDEMTHNDSMTLRVRKKMEKHKPPHYFSVKDGVASIRKGQFALYVEDEAIYHEIANTLSDAEICSLSEVEKYKPFHVGAVARNNGPYKDLFNRVFSLMRERGVMERQKSFWLLRKPECHWKQDALSLGLEPLFLAYACLFLGASLAMLFFVIEKLNHRGVFKIMKQRLLERCPFIENHVL